ncbi:MAG: hypothetical protein KatS3mg113_0203 [Planctomycetaceae bacterium]|nr:MAG: hypothetical protein KatS3mg113_0203 [Planctomycetaceae bacterium]
MVVDGGALRPRDDTVTTEEQEFPNRCHRVLHAVRTVYGWGEQANHIHQINQQTLEDWQRIQQGSAHVAAPLLIVGKVGEGKGWLTRCFFQNDTWWRDIPCGDESSARSTSVMWWGVDTPGPLQPHERFTSVPAQDMLDLGVPYVLGDAPGFTSFRAAGEVLERITRTSAALYLLVLGQETLRDRDVPELLRQLAGSCVIPVIRFRGKPGQTMPGEEVIHDVHKYWRRWCEAAAATELQPAIYVPDADLFSRAEDRASRLAETLPLVRQRLHGVLSRLLSDRPRLQSVWSAKRLHVQRDWQRRVAHYLLPSMRRILPVLDRIQQAVEGAQPRLLHRLLGDSRTKCALIRIQLRAMWFDTTPTWAFPYRSITGILMLTINHWDRLILGLLGNVTSWWSTLFHTLKNLHEWRRLSRRLQADDAELVLQDTKQALQPLLGDLHRSLRILQGDHTEPSRESPRVTQVNIFGLREFQECCREQVREVLEQHAPRRVPVVFAFLATACFWFSLGGPLISLYREYFHVDWQAWRGEQGAWQQVPSLSLQQVNTVFLVSSLPVLLLAMMGLSWTTRRKRVVAVLKQLSAQLERISHEWQQEQRLRIVWSEPLWEALQALLHELPDLRAADPVDSAKRVFHDERSAISTLTPE